MQVGHYNYSLADDNVASSKAIAKEVVALQTKMFGSACSSDFIKRTFQDITDMFLSKSKKFQGISKGYHNLEHTLQVTLCLARLLFNRHFLKGGLKLDSKDFEMGIAAALMHDVGFLKTIDDEDGTGAKYSFAQELRSCQFARTYFQKIGWQPINIMAVEKLISCTGPRSIISKTSFLDARNEFLGCAISTADYLGQMSDINYVDKLYVLYDELKEADEFKEVPMELRRYKSAADLMRKTPGFWLYVLNEKLIKNCKSVYLFLSHPYPDGANPYIQKVEENIEKVKSLLKRKYKVPILIGG